MSTQYTTEPPPTATVLLHTTAGPLTISLFAKQTPLTCRNFIQHCLDGYYDNNIFHRVAGGFVIQTGDPTGTGEGGHNIYEDREFERLDADWAKLLRTDEGEPIKFGDEIHSRLKFNRRGLVGMARGTGETGGYGSQFFITLGDCRAELDGKCTMFGRVEGEGIYNIVKIADGELIEGTERPMYPEKILRVEIIETPKGDAWQKMQKRERVAARTQENKEPVKKKPTKKKGGKALLSFGGDEGDEDGIQMIKSKKAKFNTALIDSSTADGQELQNSKKNAKASSPTAKASSVVSPSMQSTKRKADSIATRSPSPKRRKPSFHDSTTQLPIRNPESPSRSPTPTSTEEQPRKRRPSSTQSKKGPSNLAAEIEALKASMRRDVSSTTQPTKKKSALESLIPSTSTRGRRRPRAGETNSKDDQRSMNVLDAFRARLEGAGSNSSKSTSKTPRSKGKAETNSDNLGHKTKRTSNKEGDSNHDDQGDDDEEAKLCDLHFISNCQSCFADTNGGDISRSSSRKGFNNDNDDDDDNDDNNPTTFLTHSLTFEKDRLGKDLTWKKKNDDELLVIDPRDREKDLGINDRKAGRRDDRRVVGNGASHRDRKR